MKHKPNIRTFSSSEWQIYKDLRLWALADSPDSFSRTLAEEQVRSDKEWSKRLAEGVNSRLDLPLLAEIDGRPIGLAWGHIETTTTQVANLYQVWVAPGHRRLGVGQMILDAVIDRDGNIRMSWTGGVDQPTLEKFVTPLLEEKE